MNKIKRNLLKALIFFLFLMAGVYCYLAYGAYFTFDNAKREQIIAEVLSSPEIPDRFVTLYNVTNPGSADSFRGSLINYAFDSNSSDCPCKDAAAHFATLMRSGSAVKIAQLTFFIEEYATQRKCLDFTMNNLIFSNNIKGIYRASRYYYNKELENLNDDEMLELIAMSKNPYFFNKKDHPERLSEQVERLRGKMNKQ